MFLTRKGATLALSTKGRASAGTPPAGRAMEAERTAGVAVVRMTFDGASLAGELAGLDQLPGQSHYFVGSDPGRWRRNVPRYARIRHHDLYPGVDLVYYGNQGRLEYDLIVAPGIDPRRIALAFEGADDVALDGAGDLILRAGGADVRLRKPVIYQQEAAGKREIAGSYRLEGRHRVAFDLGPYDRTRALVIDPMLVYSTYLGGPGSDEAHAIAADPEGNAYVVGSTTGDFPTSNALQGEAPGFVDVFVAKFDPAGALLFSTYLGGNDRDEGRGIAVDATGIYVTGVTYSTNFPVVNPLQ